MFDEVVEFINEVRGKHGLPPITEIQKGFKENPHDDPVGNSIFDPRAFDDITVGNEWVELTTVQGVEQVYDCPLAVKVFVDAFDFGYLPQFDKEID